MSDFLKMTSEGPALNTNAMREAGKAFLNKEAAPASTPTPVASPAPVVPGDSSTFTPPTNVTVTEQPKEAVKAPEPGQEAPKAPTPAEPQVLDIPDDALVRMTVNGKEQVLPYGEAKKQMMLHRTFTQNQQQLRAQEAQLARERQALQQEAELAGKLRQIVTNPDLFVQYAQANPVLAQRLAQAFGTTVAAASAGATPQPVAPSIQNPDELANLGEVHGLLDARTRELESRVSQNFSATLEQRAQQIAEEVEGRVQQAIGRLEDAREVSAFNTEIVKKINANLEANPALKVIPRIDQLLRYEVAQLQPRTPEEMLEAFDIVSRGIVEGLNETYNTSAQIRLIEKEKLVTGGVEPPGGQAPNTLVRPPISYTGKDGKFDWGKLKDAAKASLR